MRILIDFTQIPLTRTGVGVYADHLVGELAGVLAPGDELFVLIQDDELELQKLVKASARVHFETVPSRFFRNRLALLAYEQIGLPLLLRRLRIDVIHSLHYTFPLISPAARVVTIHDLTFFLWPEMHTRDRVMLFRPFTRAALRRAEGVVFVSESTRKDAEKLVANARQVRMVTAHGVAEEVFRRPAADRLKVALAEMEIGGSYLLFVGTVEPRKNLIVLLEAFDLIAGEFQDLSLVIVGKMGWHSDGFALALSASRYKERIRLPGYVTEEQKQMLLAGASALVYPSLYEGFGLPVLEALAVGAPVVTSNVSSLPEVAGDAALLVNPGSATEIAAAIRRVLTDAELAARLRQAGPQRARQFRWSETAAKTYAAYRAVCRRD